MRILKRPQFLRDLAEELTWLNDKAGPAVAQAWYQALTDTIHRLEKYRLGAGKGKTCHPPASAPGESPGFLAG